MIGGINELEDKLKPLMHIWHECKRPNNDGNAGNTLEDLLGVGENNFSSPDFGDIEIKTQGYETGSLLTLFHFEPQPSASVPKLLKSLGWKHQQAGQKYPIDEMSFRSTTYSHRYSVRGFRVNLELNRIVFEFSPEHVDVNAIDITGVYPTYGDWLDDVLTRNKDVLPVYYDLDVVETKFKKKLDHTLLVMFKKKTVNGKKFFSYEEGIISNNLNFDMVCKLFNDGIIVVDFDARTRHNHGTKFRIKKNCLVNLFDNVRIIGN